MLWKKVFHTMEKIHGFPAGPGKPFADFSTPWKKVFHTVENFRPLYAPGLPLSTPIPAPPGLH
jgi:hypothetical protein